MPPRIVSHSYRVTESQFVTRCHYYSLTAAAPPGRVAACPSMPIHQWRLWLPAGNCRNCEDLPHQIQQATPNPPCPSHHHRLPAGSPRCRASPGGQLLAPHSTQQQPVLPPASLPRSSPGNNRQHCRCCPPHCWWSLMITTASPLLCPPKKAAACCRARPCPPPRSPL